MDTPTQVAAPPQLSPDGHWWWNGLQWEPAAAAVPTAVPVASTPAWPAAGPVYSQAADGRTDGLAIGSLICGILWLFGIGSIVAVILGHVSRSRAQREGRAKSGVALAGLILGYLGSVGLVVFGLLAAIAIPVFLNQQDKAAAATVKSDLFKASTLEETYRLDHDTYADQSGLEQTGLSLSSGVTLVVLSADDSSYCLAARETGATYYYSSAGGLSTAQC